jgi:hypothetical protein
LVSDVTRDSEPESDLKNEDLSIRLEDEPSEALRFTVRPLNRELAKPSELVRDLKNELRSRTLEPEPSEAPRDFARPFI